MKPNKQRRKELRKKFDEMPKPYAEGLWEEGMLENNSYWDLDVLAKHNAPILKRLSIGKRSINHRVTWVSGGEALD